MHAPGGDGTGQLSIYLRCARNLMVADLNGSSDPYVKVTYAGKTQKTHVIRKSLNPQWGLKLDFMAKRHEAVANGFHLEVFDHDTFNKDDPMGALRIDLKALADTNQLIFQEPLPTQGVIEFTVGWHDVPPRMLEKGKLRVHLIGGSGLAAADNNGLSDPYVKLTLGAMKHKSKTVHKTLDPKWEEAFEFRGTLKELTAQRLRLETFDHDTFSKDDPLGSVEVSLAALEVVDEKAVTAPLSHKGQLHLRLQWVADGTSAAPRPSHSQSDEVIVERGTLRMKSGTFGGWKERYFELGEEDLSYYAIGAAKEPKPLGVLPLYCIRKVLSWSQFTRPQHATHSLHALLTHRTPPTRPPACITGITGTRADGCGVIVCHARRLCRRTIRGASRCA